MLSHQDGRHSAVALLLKAALIQVSDYRLLGASGWNFINVSLIIHIGRGPSKDYSTKVWLQLAQWFLRRRFLCKFPIGFYVMLSSAVGAILVEGPNSLLGENHPMTISSTFSSY
jgi:hypothetical protein